MKIFGKRKKAAAVAKPEEAEKPKTFASDPIVEELLKKDPNEWNAKEKRMVKRYQKRMEEFKNNNTAENGDEEEKNDDNSNDSEEDEEKGETVEKSNEEKSAKVLDLSDVLESSVLEGLNSKQRRKLTRTLSQQGKEAVEEVVQEAKQIVVGKETADKKGGDPKEAREESTSKKVGTKKTEDATVEKDEMTHVKEMLNGLNSKQKRTLSRRLQREGESCLAEVRTEVEALLQGPAEEIANREPPKQESGKKRKRRRGPADLSGLTPEERLRREEQRKMQKEAAERRANGEEDTSKFKHPLNSERRRANRRKPKWLSRKDLANPEKVEHNSSGFQVRKRLKQGM